MPGDDDLFDDDDLFGDDIDSLDLLAEKEDEEDDLFDEDNPDFGFGDDGSYDDEDDL